MFESTDTVLRVPAAALAARPHGIEVAARMVDLAEAVAAAVADPPAGREPDPEVVAEAELVDEIGCWERAKARAEARQLRAMATLARRPMFAGCAEHGHDDPTHGIRGAASVVSAELRISPGQARARVELACALVEQLPSVIDALAAGRIDVYKARVIAEETRPLADQPDLRGEITAGLLTKADLRTGPQLRAAARHAVLAADASSAQQRQARARAGRGLQPPVCEPDGMASALLRLPAEDMAAFFTAVDAAARHTKTTDPDDPRTLEQIRADILADLGWSALDAGHIGCCNSGCGHLSTSLGTKRGRAAHVGVTVPMSTLLGIDEQPAHLAGYGPITPDVARRMAADGIWRRLLTDPATGALLDHGTTRYTPPQDLADFVVARDRTCRFPTCAWPAESCDLDHTTPPEQGGATADSNLGPLHRTHHVDKTHHGWRLIQPEPGRFVWTSPTGHSYQVDPEIIGPLIASAEPPEPKPPPEIDPDPPPY